MSPTRRPLVTEPPSTNDEVEVTSPTAVLYLRVSTKEQAERDGDPEGYSIPAQREACQRKGSSLGAVIVDEFVDRGESAKTADRPELQRLLKFVRESPPTYVVVHKIDRLARNRADDVAINLEFKTAGVQLVSVTENIDETPSGILLHGIMSSIAEFYSRNLANEVIKGSVQKAKSGGTPSRAPLGYLNVRQIDNGMESRIVQIDPERGPLMRWAFEAYASGEWTLRKLLVEVTDRGLTSVGGPKTPSKPLGLSHFHGLLRHPYYIGIVRYRGVLYEGRHEPLVSQEVWDRVQTLLAANNFAGERQREHPHYLKGSIYCGNCGSRLIVCNAKSHMGTIYPYFICMGRQHNRTSCTQRAIRIDAAEEAVAAYYGAIRLSKEQADQVREYVREELTKLRRLHAREKKLQDNRLRRLEGESKKLLDAHYADAVPLSLLKTEQARISKEISAAEERLSLVEGNYSSAERNLDRALALVQDCEAAYRNASDKVRRQFNQAFFKRLLIDSDYNVDGELAAPFDVLLSEDLHRAAAQRASDDLRRKVDEALIVRDRDSESEVAEIGVGLKANHSRKPRRPLEFAGFKYETLVGRTGLEPVTPCVSCKCATRLRQRPRGTPSYHRDLCRPLRMPVKLPSFELRKKLVSVRRE